MSPYTHLSYNYIFTTFVSMCPFPNINKNNIPLNIYPNYNLNLGDQTYIPNKHYSKKAQKWKYTPIYSKRHLKRYQIGKHQAMMEYMVSGSRNSPPFMTGLALEMNKCLQNSTRTRMDHQRKDHIDTKGPKQRNRLKQLQTHNLPTNDVENINSTNKGKRFTFR